MGEIENLFKTNQPTIANLISIHTCVQEQGKVFGENQISLDFSHKPETMQFDSRTNTAKPAPIGGLLVSQNAKEVPIMAESSLPTTICMISFLLL